MLCLSLLASGITCNTSWLCMMVLPVVLLLFDEINDPCGDLRGSNAVVYWS
jgi:hypothetical protein